MTTPGKETIREQVGRASAGLRDAGAEMRGLANRRVTAEGELAGRRLALSQAREELEAAEDMATAAAFESGAIDGRNAEQGAAQLTVRLQMGGDLRARREAIAREERALVEAEARAPWADVSIPIHRFRWMQQARQRRILGDAG